ncbi:MULTISPECIES: recombination regulator RecX [Bacillus]|uniref:Regulatory protein RecX n=2 Tax=Bacillus TaxID=1386 RepID=A0A0M4G6B3_9BACI|nr:MULTISPECIES: recombination regulator RecX [Bacillus]ALC80395.1 recombinase RecX [Bacillus gobiensis]MBP1083751.1 regulatory protein [Bacillus capparidis]MED1098236.1 recombination regulator RecX [Bacillus capparidis]
MAYITKISAQEKNKDRVNVFLDNKYAFSVELDVVAQFNLRKGKELDDLQIEEIRFADDVKKGFHKAIGYLSFRMRSEKEVRDFLAKKEVSFSASTEIIYRLKELNYLNDASFAEAYVSTHRKTNRKGPAVLKRELKEKGVSEEAITDALQTFSFEDQMEEAKVLTQKFLKKGKKVSTKETSQLIQQQLARKGFPFDVINAVLDEIEFENNEEEEQEVLTLHAEKAMKKYKYDGTFEKKMKVKQFLFRKGFDADMIESFLEKREDHGEKI